MRKLFTMMLITCSLASCNKSEEAGTNITVPNQTQLTQTVYADDNTGNSGVTFATTGAWTSTITESAIARSTNAKTPEWVSISPSSGSKAGDYTIHISLRTNPTGIKRSATIHISCNGQNIPISITQDAVTKDGELPKPEQPEPSGSGILKNETTGKTVTLIRVEHSVSGPEYVRIEFIGEELLVDGKLSQDKFMADFYNPLVNGRLKTGTYTVQPINVAPYPEMKNGDCGWIKSSLGDYGGEGTVKVDYQNNVYTFTMDLKTDIEKQSIKGSFTGVPKYMSEEVKVTSITLNESQKELGFGSSFTLNATILPENATDKRITWSSGNPAIATVDENGNVKAIAAGKTVITAHSHEGNKTATCEVTVGAAIAVQSITVEPTEITILKGGDSEFIQVAILPENATNQSYDWESDDKNIADYNGKGGVFGTSEGTTFITFTTKDGAKTAKLKVTVQPRPSSGNGTIKTTDASGAVLSERDIIRVDHTVLAKDEVKLVFMDDMNGNVTELTFFNPVTNGRLTAGTYTILDHFSDITGVDKYGYVKSPMWGRDQNDPKDNVMWQYYYKSGHISVAINGDTYTITFDNVQTNSTSDFESEKITGSYTGLLTYINEYIEVSSVTLDKNSLSLDLGKSAQLTATVNPQDAFNKNVTWSSSNASVANVNDGYVWATGAGTATITVTTEDGNKTSICTVTVNALPATGNGTFSNDSGTSTNIKRASQWVNMKEPKEIELRFCTENSVYGDFNFTLVRGDSDIGALKAGTYTTILNLMANALDVKHSYANTGSVTVAVNGEQYTITADITTDEGIKITGTYTGKITTDQ